MTLSDFQRAMLVEFAIREAGPGGSVEMMMAICYCIRNRVQGGWEDGNWIRVMERAQEHSAHDEALADEVELDPDDRDFQLMLRRVDDIYFSQSMESDAWGNAAVGGMSAEEGGRSMADVLTQKKHEMKYWMHLRRPVREWFKENIIKDYKNHKQRVTLGLMMFFE